MKLVNVRNEFTTRGHGGKRRIWPAQTAATAGAGAGAAEFSLIGRSELWRGDFAHDLAVRDIQASPEAPAL
jgi:hypothetical protein